MRFLKNVQPGTCSTAHHNCPLTVTLSNPSSVLLGFVAPAENGASTVAGVGIVFEERYYGRVIELPEEPGSARGAFLAKEVDDLLELYFSGKLEPIQR